MSTNLLISAAALDSMRATQERTMAEEAIIWRLVVTGAEQEDQVTVRTNMGTVAVRRALMGNPTESPLAGRIAGRTAWTLTFPHGTDVRDEDEVEVIVLDEHEVVISTDTYQVIGPLSGGLWATATRVAAVLIK